MKFGKLYKTLIEIGMKNDPRSARKVRGALSAGKKAYASSKGRDKSFFDKDSLFNPYSDTRMLYGSADREIRTIMMGVDIDTSELLMADRFNQKGMPIDLVISHHPCGSAFSNLYKVMHLQTELLKDLGMTPGIADEIMKERIDKVERGLHARNAMRVVDAAKFLDIPFMCAHTVADNMVCTFLQKMFDNKKPGTVGVVMDLLFAIPEYADGARNGLGPKSLNADRKKKAGKVYVDMTGGTEGSNRIFARLSQLGVGTVVGMHFSEEHFREAKKEHVNVVVAGHIPSDSVGMNLLLDRLIEKEDFNIIPCSGFMRYSRV